MTDKEIWGAMTDEAKLVLLLLAARHDAAFQMFLRRIGL